MRKYNKKTGSGIIYNRKTKEWDVEALDNGLLRPVGSFSDKDSAEKYRMHMEGVFRGFWKDNRAEYKVSGTVKFIKKAEADLKLDEATGMYPVLAWSKGKVYEMGLYSDRRVAWKVKREAEAELKKHLERKRERNINSNNTLN